MDTDTFVELKERIEDAVTNAVASVLGEGWATVTASSIRQLAWRATT